jgi:KipI family sensor histidine kinase inhibitor
VIAASRQQPAARLLPYGEAAWLLELEQRIDERVVARAAAIADAWEQAGHGTATPAYASVLLRYDPLRTEPEAAAAAARTIAAAIGDAALPTGRRIEIPVRYDGPDLADVAAASGCNPDELAALHAGRDYRAYFLGFLPGYAYCGELDPRIIATRLEVPRPRVPAGSVAVADGQTAIYPFESPGGWRIIGSTEQRVFDPAADRPALIQPGDTVRFVR